MARRRDKAIKIILGFKERECDSYLPKEVQVRFRKLILDELNDFYEVYLDLHDAEDESVVKNELFLKKLDEIHEELRELNGRPQDS